MTTGEEVVGDQAEVEVLLLSLKRTHMFGCDKVDGGRLELRRGGTAQQNQAQTSHRQL